MSIIQQIEQEIKYQRDYERAMEQEYKRIQAQEYAKKVQAVKEQREFEEYMADYKRDSVKFDF